MKTDKEYRDFWNNLSPKETILAVDTIERKWNEYRDLGYEVSSFLSGTFIYRDSFEYTSREPIVHFLKSIDMVENDIIKNSE